MCRNGLLYSEASEKMVGLESSSHVIQNYACLIGKQNEISASIWGFVNLKLTGLTYSLARITL
jgi:hypothetical protein